MILQKRYHRPRADAYGRATRHGTALQSAPSISAEKAYRRIRQTFCVSKILTQGHTGVCGLSIGICGAFTITAYVSALIGAALGINLGRP